MKRKECGRKPPWLIGNVIPSFAQRDLAISVRTSGHQAEF
jgi:hypothetical protein